MDTDQHERKDERGEKDEIGEVAGRPGGQTARHPIRGQTPRRRRRYGARMGRPKVQVLTGCANCANCTTSAMAHGTRMAGRRAGAVATLGLSEVATRKCRACGHAMSRHDTGEAPAGPDPRYGYGPQPAAGAPAPGWYPDPAGTGGQRWWDGQQWTPTQPPAPPAPSTPAAGWYPDPAGAGGQRWWDGTQWTEHRTA